MEHPYFMVCFGSVCTNPRNLTENVSSIQIGDSHEQVNERLLTFFGQRIQRVAGIVLRPSGIGRRPVEGILLKRG